MHPTARRVAGSVLAWTAGAAASVAVGLLALSSIQAGTAAGPPQQLAPDGLTNIGSDLSPAASPAGQAGQAATTTSGAPGAAATPPTSAQSSGPPRPPGATTSSVQRLLSSPGGTVTARCTGTSAYLVSWSPAQGYRVNHVQRGPATVVSVTFRSTTTRTGNEIEIRCVAGTPTLDDNGWDDEHGNN